MLMAFLKLQVHQLKLLISHALFKFQNARLM